MDYQKEDLKEQVDEYLKPTFWRRSKDFELYSRYRTNEEGFQGHRIKLLLNSTGVRNKRVLDVGCGLGGFGVALSKENAKVVGIDSNPRCIRIAQLRFKKNQIQSSDLLLTSGEHIPAKNETFDVVTCLHVLEHSSAPKDMAAEMTRVLKRKGTLFVIVFNRLWPYEPHFRLLGLTYMPKLLALSYIKLMRPKVADLEYHELHFFSLNDVRELFPEMEATNLMDTIILNPETLEGMYYNRSILVLVSLVKKLHLSWLLLGVLRILPIYPNFVLILRKERT